MFFCSQDEMKEREEVNSASDLSKQVARAVCRRDWRKR